MYMRSTVALLFVVGLSQALPSNSNALSGRAAVEKCPLRNPAPAGSLCGKVGRLSTPSPLVYNRKYAGAYLEAGACTTAHQCKEMCKAADGRLCKSYSFNEPNRQCTFYNQTLSEQGFTHQASSNSTFYDAACFKCSCVPNLINGGFETGQAAPWFYGYDSQVAIVKGHKSKYAISLAPNPPADYTNGNIDQYFTKCANASYDIDFDYRWNEAGDGSEQLILGMTLDNARSGTELWIKNTSQGVQNVWHHASVNWASGPETGAYITFFSTRSTIMATPVTFLIDNIAISYKP